MNKLYVLLLSHPSDHDHNLLVDSMLEKVILHYAKGLSFSLAFEPTQEMVAWEIKI